MLEQNGVIWYYASNVLLSNSVYCIMAEQQLDQIRIIAVKKVLSILGYDIINLLKYHFHKYNISLDADSNASCSFEQLYFALSKLLGPSTASLLLEQVYIELDRLADAPKC